MRSISRSEGVAAHSHLGEGHVAVYGIVDWNRTLGVKKERSVCGRDARGIRADNIVAKLAKLAKLGGREIVSMVRNAFRDDDEGDGSVRRR